MKSLSSVTRTLFVCSAAALALSACNQAEPAQKAQEFTQTTDTPAVVDVSTKFEKAIFSEVRPSDNSNTTCFTVTSFYVNAEGYGDISCVEGQSQAARVGQTARVAFQAHIGKSKLFTVSPVTRPDVECRVMTSTFRGEGGGNLTCARRQSTGPSA